MEEKICIFEDAYTDVSARAQVEREKTGAFGVLARVKLWDRPKDADITLVNAEKRYEPFWMAKAGRRTLYTRRASYPVKIENPHVTAVEVFGQRLNVDARRVLLFPALEDCESTTALTYYADALRRDTPEKVLVDYVNRHAFQDLADSTQPQFIAPTLTAVSVLQQVKSRLATPIDADTITSDELDITSLTLFYRPVYAFQYAWREKTGVIELDGLTGSVNKEGSIFGSAVRKLGSRDALFDLGADFAGMVVPGGAIVVKLIDKLSRRR